jgi:Flp pilus assembly protein TadD
MRSRAIAAMIASAAIVAVSIGANASAAHHALDLFLVRWQRISNALVELAMAARLAPDVERKGVVRALALDAAGKREQADAELTEIVEDHPFDRDALSLLVRYRLDRHDVAGALTYARRLAALEPSNWELQRLVQRLTPVRGD